MNKDQVKNVKFTEAYICLLFPACITQRIFTIHIHDPKIMILWSGYRAQGLLDVPIWFHHRLPFKLRYFKNILVCLLTLILLPFSSHVVAHEHYVTYSCTDPGATNRKMVQSMNIVGTLYFSDFSSMSHINQHPGPVVSCA